MYTGVKRLLETYNLLDFIHIFCDTNCVLIAAIFQVIW